VLHPSDYFCGHSGVPVFMGKEGVCVEGTLGQEREYITSSENCQL